MRRPTARPLLPSHRVAFDDFDDFEDERKRVDYRRARLPLPTGSGCRRCACAALFVCVAAALVFVPPIFGFWLNEADFAARQMAAVDLRGSFVVMMNTFGEPRGPLARHVQHYADCPLVRKVYVTHAGDGTPNVEASDRVEVLQREDSSLNSRFEPIPDAPLDATFVVDDDVLIPCDDLLTGVEAWRGAPDTIVGYFPRLHTKAEGEGGQPLWRYSGWWRVRREGRYSIVLTKAAFLHRRYLELYTSGSRAGLAEAKAFVAREKNCEDILMQFLVALESGRAPLWVRGRAWDAGIFNGVSTKSSDEMVSGGIRHFADRSRCLNELTRLLQAMPLRSSTLVVGSAKRLLASTPANLFEWYSSDMWQF